MKFLGLLGMLSLSFLFTSCASNNTKSGGMNLNQADLGRKTTAADVGRKVASVDAAFKQDIFRVGEIKTSILDAGQFVSIYGSVWVLMNGSPYPGSGLAQLTGRINVPDARGAFLRMQNNTRNDGQQNPEEKQLGEAQSDGLKDHVHDLAGGTYGGNAALRANFDNRGGSPIMNSSTSSTRGGLSETRPKNITVNFFMKIDNCPVQETDCL